MTRVHDSVGDYLTIRRALGFKLVEHQRLLNQFASDLEQTGEDTITTRLAVEWAARTTGTESWKATRLSIVRGFARYYRTLDPATEVPPEGLLLGRPQHAIPYLYSDQEVSRLIRAAGELRPALRAASYSTIIGLLAVTGMRIGEALALDRDDVDLEHGVLTVRDTKFGKSRQLPLHPTATAALNRYVATRDRLCPKAVGPGFFESTRGGRPEKSSVQASFREIRTTAGLDRPGGGQQPRLHDLRHRFAVRTLLDWHRNGTDVQARLLWLATYMGHAKPESSYWYLTAAPELLALAAQRLETTLGELP